MTSLMVAGTEERTARSGGLVRIGVFLAVMVAFAGWKALQPAIASATPAVTTSYYVDTESGSTIQSWGCTAGQSGKSGTIILDFGRPAYSSSLSAYGTINLDGSGVFLSNGAIQTLIHDFATGWYNCSGISPKVKIAWGTNNCINGSGASGCNIPQPQVPSFTTAGTKWSQFTNSFGSWLSSSGFSSQESAAGAIDAEPAWNPGWNDSHDLIAGYNSISAPYIDFDYGSLDPGYWTNTQEYYVAWNNTTSFPFPEVYNTTVASEWESLDEWAAGQSAGSMYFEGVMCTTTGLSCSSAYSTMLSDLQSHSSTTQSSIPYLTQIKFG